MAIEINQLKSQIAQLSEQEAKTFLLHTLIQTKNQEMYNLLMKKQQEAAIKCDKVHIIFGDSASGSLKYMLRKIRSVTTEQVITFADDYSYGPIWKLHTGNGQEIRASWIHTYIGDEIRKPLQSVAAALKQIDKGTPIYIWTSKNAQDQIGLLLSLYLLKNHSNDIYIIDVDTGYRQLHEFENCTFDFITMGSITPEYFDEIEKMNMELMPLTKSKRKHYEKQWLKVAETQENLHIYQNETLQSVRDDYFDHLILESAQSIAKKGFVKSARLIGEVLGHAEFSLSDSFIEYRLQKLIADHHFDVKGHPAAMRFYELRLRE